MNTPALNQGLTFLAVASGFIILIVGGFLTKLLIDLSKLTKNLNETTSIVKSEIEPTLREFNSAMKNVNSIVKNANSKVDNLAKILENVMGVGTLAVTRAKNFSGGLVKGLTKFLVTVVKIFLKK